MPDRSNPFVELFDLMTNQFENAMGLWQTSIGHGRGVEMTRGGSPNGVDIADYEDEFEVTIDVPGFETDDLEIRLSDQTLEIRGENRDTRDEMDERYIRRERRTQSFSRRIDIPEPIDDEAVSTSINNGVLTITLAKRDTEDTETIEIE